MIQTHKIYNKIGYEPLQAANESTEQKTTHSIAQLTECISQNTGLVSSHLLPLQQVAKEQDSIIGVRPVDRFATDLIAAGYPTKNFHIKGKSASWGAQAGLICVDQRFSKLENKSEDLIDKYNGFIRRCIEKGHARPIPLEITEERLHTLLQMGAIDNLSLENSQGVKQFTAKGPSLKSYQFEAKWEPQQQKYRIYFEKKYLQVLAPIDSCLPITADYDLLLIGPHMRDFGHQDMLPVPDVAHSVYRQRVEKYQRLPTDANLSQAYRDENHFYQNEDSEIGNASPRVREMISLINRALVGEAEKVVHHSVDATSPVTDLDANFPATFALPKKIGRFDELCIITNKEELVELITTSKAEGYHIKTNPLWEKELPTIRRPSFEYAKRRLSTVSLNSKITHF
ncbi:TPA: anthrax toxin-like adenylyl cyclase domain-containing protein [Providencia stuartii]|uniref:anthrax toxin-like adenylyl cyclase domain-containing protein n=1 Tax=Providencia stuartii TaxID=588 RepID=UPI0011406D9C|nr:MULTISPECIES: anthrax toxin-like adenylyl cyclase domain-containing protein [Providencia]MBN5562057.1 adenylate cyclase [Providencia stuartii]MBN5599102.1 adenylate cyclase [Providencia stuartii]MBN5605955.1 adenylate cyclase [Providencia stuartii]MCL8325814.1 CyaA/EF/ExoY family adenylyl cyclase toxin [Providencia thailandensis]MDF4174361.1 anthrax toxin-like adenylyl cyclase domain-containing protein [Providencia thailandensis]